MNWIAWLMIAQGGPPLLTDDPGTPGAGRTELNVAFTIERFHHEDVFETPLIDFNYGVGERIQLKIELPWLVKHERPGSDESGLGNVLVGFKYRFIDQDLAGVDLSLYPQAEFLTNIHSRRTGLVSEGPSLLLPAQAARDFGFVAVNVEFGLLLVEEDADAWFWGMALGHDIIRGIELLGEIHGESGIRFDHGEAVLNVGARIRLSGLNTLLVAAGRGIHGEARSEPDVIGYLGLQFSF